MKKLEKLIENVTKIIEEEYDKVMLDKSEDMKDYKELIEQLLKFTNSEDTPLGIWTMMFIYMGMEYRECENLTDKIDDLEKKLTAAANELGF